MTSPALTLAWLPLTLSTMPTSSTPSPAKRRLMPSSAAANSTNWRTLYCTPVAMTKSSGWSCCSISHCIST
jgi:hypothetical protein